MVARLFLLIRNEFMKYVNRLIALILLIPLFLFSACGGTDDLPMNGEENNEIQL